jgi:hypothetical protein
MAAWAWPVEGWDLLDTDDDFSDEAELGVADGIAAAVDADDPQEGANINRMDLLSQHFGDS